MADLPRTCNSKVKLADDSLVCDRNPHNRTEPHSATVAMKLQPNSWNGNASEKWIYGKVTWTND